MRHTALALILAAALASAAPAQDTAIQNTIQSQIDAFLADDVATAFTFASPSIQSMFGTAERFGAMVENGYPMVWRPEDVRFGELREIAGALWQKVYVVDADGKSHALDYRMIQQDGEWRISAVQLLPMPELNA